MDENRLGALLKQHRLQKHRSLNAVGHAIGFSQAFVHGVENGKTQPRLAIIQGLCDALALRPDERQEILTAAGYASSGSDSETSALMRRLTDVLTSSLTSSQKEEFTSELTAFIDRWTSHQRPGKQTVTVAVMPAAGWQNQLLHRERFERTLLHAVAEAIAASIEELILVLAPNNPDVELLDQIFGTRIEVRVAIQEQPAGLGHALLQALPFVGERAFALILPDELDEEGRNATHELIQQYQDVHQPLIAVGSKPISTSARLARHYGLTVLGRKVPGHAQVYRVKDLVEKPTGNISGEARCIHGRYILTPDIFGCIKPNAGPVQRYELTDALKLLLNSPKAPYAYRLDRTLKPLAPLRAMIEEMDSDPLLQAAHYADESGAPR